MPWRLLPRVSVCCGLAQPGPRAAATSCWPGVHRPCPASLCTVCHPWPSPLAMSCLWPGLGASVEGWPLSCVPWAHAVSEGVESWSVLRMTFRSRVMVGSYGDSGPAGRDPGAGKMQPSVFRAAAVRYLPAEGPVPTSPLISVQGLCPCPAVRAALGAWVSGSFGHQSPRCFCLIDIWVSFFED